MPSCARNIRLVYAIELLLYLHLFAAVLVPFYTQWGQVPFARIMLLQTLFSVAIVAFEVPTGVLADRVGRRTSMAVGAAILAGAVLLYGWRPSYGLFAVAEVLWALGFACISGADNALVYDSLKACGRAHEAKQVLGRKQSGLLIAILVSGPIGSLVASHWGLRATMLLTSVPMALAGLLSLALVEPPRGDGAQRPTTWQLFLSGVRHVRHEPQVRRLVLDQVAVSAPVFFVIWTYQVRLGELGVPVAWYGVVMAATSAVQIPVTWSYHHLERWAGSRRRYLVLSALLPGLGYLGLAATRQVEVVVPCILVIAAFGLTRGTLVESYVHHLVPSAQRASIMSTISMLDRAVKACAYPLVGLLVERSSTLAFAVLGGALVALAAGNWVHDDGPPAVVPPP